MSDVLESLRGGIIVSCQAVPDDPTYGPAFMAAFAKAAQRGGAVGIRANGPDDIAAVKAATTLPVIGIWKRPCTDGQGIIITPSLDDAIQLRDAGADIIAGDVSDRPRPGGIDAATLIKNMCREVGLPFMADCGTLAEALMSQEAGAAIAATTRAHPPDLGLYEPDLDLLRTMSKTLHIPVIAEGRFWNPDDVQRAFASGAHAVVIGSAVTRPWLITERYVAVSPSVSNRG